MEQAGGTRDEEHGMKVNTRVNTSETGRPGGGEAGPEMGIRGERAVQHASRTGLQDRSQLCGGGHAGMSGEGGELGRDAWARCLRLSRYGLIRSVRSYSAMVGEHETVHDPRSGCFAVCFGTAGKSRRGKMDGRSVGRGAGGSENTDARGCCRELERASGHVGH